MTQFCYRLAFSLLYTALVPLSAAKAETTLDTRLLPSPRLTLHDGDMWSVNTRGRYELDSVEVDNDTGDHVGGIYDRRVRLGLDMAYSKHWSATAEVDFAEKEDVFTDLALEYDNLQNMRVQAGHFKESFGMERVDSSSVTLFNERAAIDTFAPARNLGMQMTFYGDHASASFGAFTDSMVSNSKKDKLGLTSRVTYAVPFSADSLLHLGTAGSLREMEVVSFGSGPDTDSTGIDVVSTGDMYDADTLAQGGLELAYVWHSLMLEGEYMRAHVSRDQNPDTDFDGWYFSAAWMLTGEQRPYSPAKNAVFGAFSPEAPFSLRQGTWGAWEVAARVQELDLNDDTLKGGEMQAVTGGLNWYPNKEWRISANVTQVMTDEYATIPNDDPTIYSLRLRVSY